MDWDNTVWRRKSNRAKDYDYSRACAYLVTVCIEGRLPLLGEIAGGESVLNAAGEIVKTEWLKLPDRFDGLHLDAFVIMPDHFHGIVLAGKSVGDFHVPDQVSKAHSWTLGNVVGAFKSITTGEYIKGIKENVFQQFDKRLWQRDYNDGIIGTDSDLARARIYVQNNPNRWEQAHSPSTQVAR